MTLSDDWVRAEAALTAGRWDEAADLFARVAETEDSAAAYESLAQAAWWLDDAERCLEAREAAYRGFRRVGDDRGAGRAATALGYDSMLFGGGVAVGRGWLARAAELLADLPDLPEAGWLAARQAEAALNVDHDAAAALVAATRAHEVGRRTGDVDLAIVGHALTGLAQVRLGRVTDGMAALDATAAAATAGDVANLMWVGKICCWLISACQETQDLGRASDWCARVEAISQRHALAPLFAVCRTQYASVLLAGGNPRDAELALTDVLTRLEHSRRVTRLDAVAQLGELRRRQGRLAEAERLLAQAGYLPAAVASLAKVRLDEGDADRAWSTITELLRSIRPDQLLDRVDALRVAVTAGAASGHLAEAKHAAAELREIADRVGTIALSAQADAAEARVVEDQAAVVLWQDAARRFHLVGLPFDEADARTQLAQTLRRLGDLAGAGDQERRALAAQAPLRERTSPLPLTERQIEVLQLVAAGLNNGEIAARLQLSEHTVHRHVANIYTALGIGSRAAAAAYAARHGLIGGSNE